MAMLPNPLPKLAADPTGGVLGLDLPPGALIDTTFEGHWHEPLLWCAEAPARPGDWSRLLTARRAAGLHPVLISGDEEEDDEGPQDWELSPGQVSYPGDHDAEEVLADYWEEYAADDAPDGEGGRDGGSADDTTIAPYGPDWPGLARPFTSAPTPESEADARAAEVADSLTERGGALPEPRIALVPARRSADIPAAIGWTGPLNYDGDVARLCAVLRSWEDRFGIRVVALTFDQLIVSVAAPPTTAEEAEALAVEHFAFCPDNITQSDYGTLREYAAKQLLNRRSWSFWWD
ncbi:DUF4253 domain-containing protein [Streptomyces sp. NPDC050560]|uniref:DUF4253 domain-containing protein n=1 Tax=Streptomyces sp. NPDC050560 TaxID=3365630 RepID=UPI0037B152BF